jgi:hypothetical protein
MAPEPVEDGRPYSASEFETVYKIPIEFAMLEIINCIISGSVKSFMKNGIDRMK